MPTELKGANELRKALKKFSPDLDKATRDEMVGFLKPLVKKAKGFLPANNAMPSGFVKHDVKTATFPMYDASEARRGVGYKLTPTKRSAALEKGIAAIEKYKRKYVIQQTMIDVVKKLYTDRDIQNVNTAISALDSLMSDDTSLNGNTQQCLTRYPSSRTS